MPSVHPAYTLYWYPGSCSRVVMWALAEAGQPYEDVFVDLLGNAQSQDAYSTINPKRKVPALLVGSSVLTETAAIIRYLSLVFPDAGLLPTSSDSLESAMHCAHLLFCSATLHPIVRGLGSPQRLTTGDTGPVRVKAMELAELNFGIAELRLSTGDWWYGQWSMLDVYIGWAFAAACTYGLNSAGYPALRRHGAGLEQRPAAAAVMAREQARRLPRSA